MNTRRFYLICFSSILLSTLAAQQRYYTFTELKGMEDNSGNTHLFYRMYTFQKGGVPFGDYYENSIHHFDVNNGIDTIFLKDGQFSTENITRITDFEFWNNDPAKFIYCGESIVVDPVAFIRRFDQTKNYFQRLGEVLNLEIGKQNDSLIIASAPHLIKSTDGGFSWASFYDSINYAKIISISPYTDDVMFFMNDGAGLFKSENEGKTLHLVDTSQFGVPAMVFDADSVHVYSISCNDLNVSIDHGNAFSWVRRYHSSIPIQVSIDRLQSGKVFLSDGKRILVSEDYGLTFNEYVTLDGRIVGIYKKPNSDKLYAATKYSLYEISKDTIVTLKHLALDPDVFCWFPIQVGNKWVYNAKFLGDGPPENYVTSIEVTGTFLYKNRRYFKFGDNSPFVMCYRVDSTSGRIYKSYFYDDSLTHEELFLDLTADAGDTVGAGNGILFESQSSFSSLGLQSVQNRYIGLSTPALDLRIVKGLGVYYLFEWELVGSLEQLKGAIINGIVYGDTTVLGVGEVNNDFPKAFHLTQNYPNPFNPTTKLDYYVPHKAFVSIKIYDVIGREVTTLVDEEKDAGIFKATWNASKFSSGMYFVRMSAGNFSSTKKLLLIK